MIESAGLEHCLSFINCQLRDGGKSGTHAVGGVRHTVTISRQAGCGALAVAQKLAEYLQSRSPKDACPWTVFDRNLMDKVLEDHNLPTRLARLLPENTVSKMILIGRGGTVITAKLPHVLHVRLVAPLEKRVEYAHKEYNKFNLTRDQARKFCLNEDRGRERYLKKYFNADINDPLLYHMIINTGLVNYDDAAKMIGDAVLNLH